MREDVPKGMRGAGERLLEATEERRKCEVEKMLIRFEIY